MQRAVFLLFLLFPLPGLCNDVYKCKVDGRVIYAQQPCSNDAVLFEVDSLTVANSVSRGSVSPLASPVSASGFLRVPFDNRNGGYFVRGFVDGLAIRAQIDTGASSTAISSPVAARIGADSCHASGRSSTANGVVQVCYDTVKMFSFGDHGEFVFKNVRITVMPDMSIDMLIGDDLLNQLHFVQHNGVITFSK